MDAKSRIADAKVGAFVLVALVILIAGSLWVAGSTLFGVKHVPYVVVLKNSEGVQPGDRVRFAGVSVGRVRGIDLRPGSEWPVVMRVSLQPTIPVKTDSRARIATAGFMGGSFLVIDAGSLESPRLPPGGTIRGEEVHGLDAALAHVDEISEKVIVLLDKTTGLLDQVSSQTGPILSRVEQLLSEDNVASLQHTLGTLDRTVDDAAPRISSLLDKLDSIAGRADESFQDVPGLTHDLKEVVAGVRAALGENGARLSALLDTANGALASAGDSLSIVRDNRTELEWTLRDLRDTAGNLKAFSQTLKERPFSLVRIQGEPDRKPGQDTRGGSR
jgi:phospholipid/cholesterol/gamma-HCH transport system substrate-binding protein